MATYTQLSIADRLDVLNTLINRDNKQNVFCLKTHTLECIKHYALYLGLDKVYNLESLCIALGRANLIAHIHIIK